MELRYAFDKAKYELGTLCKHGHAWPGTELSLRRRHRANNCMGCRGRKQSDWLMSFLDYEAMGWPPELTLGKVCRRGHQWRGINATLRVSGRCMECDQDKAAERRKTPPGPRMDPRERKRLYKARIRQQNYSQGLTSRGTTPLRWDGGARRGEHAYKIAIDRAGRCPNVARLVMDEQLRYWQENPEAKAEHGRKWAQASWWLEYQINPDLRLYHREKSKRRKAQDRGQTPVQIPIAAIRQRFNSFGNCCAYCGSNGYMELEHVAPISDGGAHDISNIVPACHGCNASKRAKPMEEWYRAQPFFSEIRLRRIQRVTGDPSGQQLALALA